jgi:predicted nuclease with TOPRIM domain
MKNRGYRDKAALTGGTKALREELESLRSENESLKEQLTTVRQEALRLFEDKNRTIIELGNQVGRKKTTNPTGFSSN